MSSLFPASSTLLVDLDLEAEVELSCPASCTLQVGSGLRMGYQLMADRLGAVRTS